MDLTVIFTIVISCLGSVAAIIGSNIALISWLRADMKSFENKIETKLDSWKDQINSEMRDFHGRLERQDAEHKASMQNIDLRFKQMENKGYIRNK